MENESFVFYKSFFEAIEMIPKESQLDIYKALCNYSFNGELPNGIDGTAKAMFILMKPNIDSANKRYKASVENGKKGGAPKGNQNASKEKQPKNNLKTSKNNLNDNVDVDYNDNYNDNKEEMFEDFWKSYPKKLDKQKSRKKFLSLNIDEKLFEVIISKLEDFKNSPDWKKNNGQFIPYASTWLNNARWEDEMEKVGNIDERFEKLKKEGKI